MSKRTRRKNRTPAEHRLLKDVKPREWPTWLGAVFENGLYLAFWGALFGGFLLYLNTWPKSSPQERKTQKTWSPESEQSYRWLSPSKKREVDAFLQGRPLLPTVEDPFDSFYRPR